MPGTHSGPRGQHPCGFTVNVCWVGEWAVRPRGRSRRRRKGRSQDALPPPAPQPLRVSASLTLHGPWLGATRVL